MGLRICRICAEPLEPTETGICDICLNPADDLPPDDISVEELAERLEKSHAAVKNRNKNR